MSDKIEVDRADLEAVSRWWGGVGYEECGAAVKRIRKLLEPPQCAARWVPGIGLTSYACWLQKGHDGGHEVDSNRWVES